MTSVVAVIACLLAIAAFVQARRLARQLAQLTEMYWQLKYEHGELKAAVRPPADPPSAVPVSAFVPLGAVKRGPS
jgi:hypothetical protein